LFAPMSVLPPLFCHWSHEFAIASLVSTGTELFPADSESFVQHCYEILANGALSF
jgi:hypothetical protein